jgi:hypothetical protein
MKSPVEHERRDPYQGNAIYRNEDDYLSGPAANMYLRQPPKYFISIARGGEDAGFHRSPS